jgi:hypothetical protein
MSPDIAMVIGIIIAGFSIPSIMSALSDRRAPRASALTVLIAGGLIVYAVRTHPGGYRFEDLPDVFVRVVAQFI